jgi:hypothetical protein
MYKRLHVKYPLLLSDFNKTWIFSIDFSKNTQTSNFMKISPVGNELLHAGARTDGRTDMTKLVVALRNFTNARKNGICQGWKCTRSREPYCWIQLRHESRLYLFLLCTYTSTVSALTLILTLALSLLFINTYTDTLAVSLLFINTYTSTASALTLTH